jgi:hypothetical protein
MIREGACYKLLDLKKMYSINNKIELNLVTLFSVLKCTNSII